MKRIFDLFSSFFGIVFLFPILIIISIAILATDGFPILFKQRRVGFEGHDFWLYKFRTMTNKKDASLGSFDAGDSSRITKIGRILRKAKLDELPQLFNVFIGDMSIVGPRPEVRKWVEIFPEKWEIIHRIKPGITDPASIVYRDEEVLLKKSSKPERTYREQILPHKLALYEDYVRNRTFIKDINIIFKTIASLFFSREK